MVSKKEFIEEAKRQVFKRSDVNGVDVFIWLFRHIGRLIILIPVMLSFLAYAWTYHVAPKVDERASRLDTLITVPILDQTEKNKCKIRDTYYIVKKMELVQKRTSPAGIVLEAEEEIEIEKIIDGKD